MEEDPGYDGPVCIQIFAWHINQAVVKNTKVISNEFYNQNDGFQIVRHEAEDGYTTPYQDLNAEGTIIYDNDFTKDRPYMENAVDFKAGGDNSSNPIIMENNRIWGYWAHEDYDPNDPSQGSNKYPPGRTAVVVHFAPRNLHIRNNVFFNSSQGIRAGSDGPRSGFPEACIDSQFTNNLFYNCGIRDQYTSNSDYNNPLEVVDMKNTQVEHNTIITHHANEWCWLWANHSGSTFQYNEVVNGSYVYRWRDGYEGDGGDSAFEATMYNNTDNGSITAEQAGYTEDFVFTYDKYTNNPKVMTLTNAVKPA